MVGDLVMPFGDMFLSGSGNSLAVVPIVVNAGAAILPAMAAGIATFFALLFKPKELLKACKEKPWIPMMVLMIGGGIYATIHFWPAAEQAPAAGRRSGGGSLAAGANGGHVGAVYIDWTEIAMARIQEKERMAAFGGHQTETGAAPEQATSSTIDASTATTTSSTASHVIFRGDILRRGSIGAAPQGNLNLLWDYFPSWVDDDGTVMVEKEAMILSSPAVHGNRVFAASCVLDPPDSYGIVFCVDAITGKTIWSVDLINDNEVKGFFSSPAVTADGKYMIIGQGLHPDMNCQLICIDTASGEVHWTVDTALHLESSPAIEDGVVYIGAGAIEDPVTRKPKSHTGYVMAVRISDGKQLWKHDVADPESSPIVKDGVLYIGSGFNGNAVVALRTETDEALGGKPRQLWKTQAPYPITGAVTLLDDKVIVGGGNGDFVFRDPNPAGVVMALDAKTGEIKWQTPMPDAVLGAVAADKYLICPVAKGKVIALDPMTGKEVWSQSISGKAPVLAGAAVADGFVYAVSNDGYLGKLSLSDGKLIKRIYINAKDRPGEQALCISSPMIVNGRLFVGTETGGLRAYAGGN